MSSSLRYLDLPTSRRRSRSLRVILMGLLANNAAGWVAIPPPSSLPLPKSFSIKSLPSVSPNTDAQHSSVLYSNYNHYEGEYIGNKPKKQRKAWHRAITKLLRRRSHEASEGSGSTEGRSAMHMISSPVAPEDATIAPSSLSFSSRSVLLDRPRELPSEDTSSDFIRANFHSFTPQDLQLDTTAIQPTTALPPLATPTKKPSSKRRRKSKTRNAVDKVSTTINKFQGGTLLTKWTRQWFQNTLWNIIERRSVVPPAGLLVQAAPRGWKAIRRGLLGCDLRIHFDRVVFSNIRLSGGGTLEAKRLWLNLPAFFGGPLTQNQSRYARAFEIVAHNCTLTQDDLLESSCIRNGLARLLVRILSNAGVTTAQVQVTSVKILPSKQIGIAGVATTDFGSNTPFEVRSGLGTSSRGHILTFPGLEVSLNPLLGVFVPVLPEIALDIGHNARLVDIEMDVRRRRLTLSACATVTPDHTRILKDYSQPRDSFLAQYTYDVGRWITQIGNFAN